MTIIGNDGIILLFLYSLNKSVKRSFLAAEVLQNVAKRTGRYLCVDDEAVDLFRPPLLVGRKRQCQPIVSVLDVDLKRCLCLLSKTDVAIADLIGRRNDGVCRFHFFSFW